MYKEIAGFLSVDCKVSAMALDVKRLLTEEAKRPHTEKTKIPISNAWVKRNPRIFPRFTCHTARSAARIIKAEIPYFLHGPPDGVKGAKLMATAVTHAKNR